MSLVDMYYCKNFIEIAEKADKILQAQKQKQEQGQKQTNNRSEFDFDWFLRFFEAAGKIRNEEMQELWARILAGEIQNQGMFSLRTLETLRNMRPHEAAVSQKASNTFLYNIENLVGFVFYDDRIDEYDIAGALDNRDIRVLENAGLAQSARRIAMKKSVLLDKFIFYSGNACLQIKELDEKNHPFNFDYYPLTEAAMQLAEVVDRSEGKAQKYMLHLGYVLKKEYGEFFAAEVNWFKLNMKEDGCIYPAAGRDDYLKILQIYYIIVTKY